MNSTALAFEDVSFFREGEHILSQVSLSVERGEFLAVIGPNGGGKTTLLKLILGVFTPGSGTIRVFGQPPERMNRNIGYVPQFSTIRPDFPASVQEMVMMGAARATLCGARWSTGRAAREAAAHYLEVLGLSSLSGHSVGALSGGERQRAMVARALMGRPGRDEPFLLLLDEPTASIDPQGTFCFYEFLGKLRGNVTIVVVSHDLMLTSPFFSSIAFINRKVTLLPGTRLTPEVLTSLFGQHAHHCPVADLQQATENSFPAWRGDHA